MDSTMQKQAMLDGSLNYAKLKQQGIDYIQSLAGNIWTDYNQHDPGITILEQLCYAMTDLAYRTDFDITDLLAEDPNHPSDTKGLKHFYTAEEILPSNPLTIHDCRKLIADISGVRNVKIVLSDPTKEIRGGYKIFIDAEEQIVGQNNNALIDRVKKVLYQHRNLCEDFFEIHLLKPYYLCIHATVEINSKSVYPDGESLLAELYFNIQSFISPYIKSYSLQEMLLKKGKTVEEIYTGFLPTNNFIDDDELENANIKSTISVTEILEKITELKNFDNVKKFSITTQDSSVALQEDFIEVPIYYVPKLAIDRSHIVLLHKNLEVFINPQKMHTYLRDIINKKILKKSILVQEILTIPQGNFRSLDKYTSIQHDFPLIYGIGTEGLPKSSSTIRKAQAKQLKGFLLFFDQIFANYLAQLAQIKELLAMQAVEKRATYTQALQDVPDFQKLIKYHNTNEQIDQEYYIQRKYLDFVSFNKKHNIYANYKKYLDSIIASSQKEQKNKILDHLLARFAESFSEYAVFSYDKLRHYGDKNLIYDKKNFLKDYIKISNNRNKAFDLTHTQDHGWDSENISGFEQRLCRALGIRNLRRRFLYSTVKNHFYIEKNEIQQHFRVFFGQKSPLDKHNLFIFKGKFPNIRNYAIRFGIDKNNYTVINNSNKKGYEIILYINKNNDQYIQLVNDHYHISTLETAEAIIQQAVTFFNTFNRLNEGFHLIEHILLRNKNTLEGSNDFYSCMMTMVFPSWPARFQNENFRNLVYEYINLESPAHIFINVLWLDVEEMEIFEKAYKDWLQCKLKFDMDDSRLKNKSKNLLGLIMMHSAH